MMEALVCHPLGEYFQVSLLYLGDHAHCSNSFSEQPVLHRG